MTTIYWFRRDRRLQDSGALAAATDYARAANRKLALVYPLADLNRLAPVRAHSILESLRSLDADLAGALTVLPGDSAAVLVNAARELGAAEVFATEAFDPEGMAEQSAVAQALAAVGTTLTLRDSYYAVRPGTVVKDDGSAVRVYTPFYKRWLEHGWQPPIEVQLTHLELVSLGQHWPKIADPPFLIRAGEAFALRTWRRFQDRALDSYDELRNRTDLAGTSHLSHALAHGEIHPRTLLAQLGASRGHEVYRKELAWREFYADVLFRNPHTLSDYYEPRFAEMRYDSGPLADARFEAWTQGRTGYPMVDAAMRQLLETGWMHNRARMIVASFLVKDLHLEWQLGANWFERLLTDYDPASNSHGWQWTAGCGTDASPYYRVFNPVLQGLKFDPDGDYVRKFIPELRHIAGVEVHEPWKLIDGLAHGYPAPIVDHALERDESLARLEEIKGR